LEAKLGQHLTELLQRRGVLDQDGSACGTGRCHRAIAGQDVAILGRGPGQVGGHALRAGGYDIVPENA
jgi:hypothetical protein